jgi:hypothetical protein
MKAQNHQLHYIRKMNDERAQANFAEDALNVLQTEFEVGSAFLFCWTC